MVELPAILENCIRRDLTRMQTEGILPVCFTDNAIQYLVSVAGVSDSLLQKVIDRHWELVSLAAELSLPENLRSKVRLCETHKRQKERALALWQFEESWCELSREKDALRTIPKDEGHPVLPSHIDQAIISLGLRE